MATEVYATVQTRILPKKTIGAIIGYILKTSNRAGADVSVHLIGDRRMRTLNNQYRGKDTTTDVLSFPIDDPSGSDLGDIFISPAQIRRQAREYKVSQKEECTRMLVHGVLHLMGYDHITKKQAAIMFPLQEELLAHCMQSIV